MPLSFKNKKRNRTKQKMPLNYAYATSISCTKSALSNAL